MTMISSSGSAAASSGARSGPSTRAQICKAARLPARGKRSEEWCLRYQHPPKALAMPAHSRAVPRPGTVGHIRDLPCYLARERSERSWQSRHGPESSQDPSGNRARNAEAAAADACLARPVTAEPWRRQYSSANRASPKPTGVLTGGADLGLFPANLAQAPTLEPIFAVKIGLDEPRLEVIRQPPLAPARQQSIRYA